MHCVAPFENLETRIGFEFLPLIEATGVLRLVFSRTLRAEELVVPLAQLAPNMASRKFCFCTGKGNVDAFEAKSFGSEALNIREGEK